MKKAVVDAAVDEREIEPLFKDIVNIIEEARNNTYRAVNFEMVKAYWNIGRLIVEKEQGGKEKAEYGKELIVVLSKRLVDKFGKGFSVSNLFDFRRLYLHYTKLQALPVELSWTHYRSLLKIEKEAKRTFYINEAIENRWSTRQLDRMINTKYYERLLVSKEKNPVIKEMKENLEEYDPKEIIKEPYLFDFLDFRKGDRFFESDLEKALLENLKEFMLELGKGFSLVDSQYRISIEGDHFYVDLVFFNYILNCFLLIDLKTGKLNHGDIGQMDFYVRYFEQEVRLKQHNPTIGLILCADKNKSMIKYTLLNDNDQVFASKYKTYLPTEEELQKEIERGRLELSKERF